MLPYTLPLAWLSSRASTPEVLLRRYGDGGRFAELVAAMEPGDEVRKFNSPRLAWGRRVGDLATPLFGRASPLAWWSFG